MEAAGLLSADSGAGEFVRGEDGGEGGGFGVGAGGEPRAGVAGERGAEICIAKYFANGGGEGCGGFGRDEEAALAIGDDFGDAADGRGDDGEAMGHGFEESEGHGFGAGGKDEDVGAAHFFVNGPGGGGAGEMDAASETEGAGKGEEFGALGAVAGEFEREGEAEREELGGGAEDEVDALFGAQAGDAEDAERT